MLELSISYGLTRDDEGGLHICVMRYWMRYNGVIMESKITGKRGIHLTGIEQEITLEELIREAFLKGNGKVKFGKNKKSLTEVADKLISWFLKYYRGEKRIQARETILNQKLSRLRINVDEFCTDLIEGIRLYPHDKYQLTIRIEHILKYLNEQYDFKIDLLFLENLQARDKYDRLLKILKYLHCGSKTREDISQAFAISERVVSDDLSTLLDGFEFMGTTMQINELERGLNTYSSLIHPAFLALNTAEIFALTVGLKLLAKDTIFGSEFDRIADLIYVQLSDYARNIVDQHALDNEISFPGQIERKFLNSMEFVKLQRPFSYYLKESIPCKVVVRLDGLTKTLTGTLQLAPPGPERFHKVALKTSEGEIILDIDDIVDIDKQ